MGWGQDLHLRCHAVALAALKSSPLVMESPEPPWSVRLFQATHVTARAEFHHGNFIGEPIQGLSQ